MSDQSLTSSPASSKSSISAISSAGSQGGPSLFDALGGEDDVGPEVAPVLPLAPQERKRLVQSAKARALSRALAEPESSSAASADTPGTLTDDISSPSSIASSLSADLQWFLGNRFREEMDLSGSPECELEWNQADMLLGPQICRLRASARRTFDSGSSLQASGWRSPTAEDGDRGVNSHDSSGASHLQQQANMAGWPTPQAHDSQEQGKQREVTETGRIRTHNGDSVSANLPAIVATAVWPTPMAGSPGTEEYNPAGNTDSSRKTMLLALGPTPSSSPAETTNPKTAEC